MMQRSALVVAAVLTALLLCCCVALNIEAKGTFGGSRSSGGGYIRTSKTGYYSTRQRYYTSGMYWHTGSYRYSSSSYTGQSSRTAALSQADLTDLNCKRYVEIDDTGSAVSSMDEQWIGYNSTQFCFKELYAAPGDPRNLPFEQLMLSRFQFNVSLSPWPTVVLNVYPDKEIYTPVVNVSFRVLSLFINNGFSTYSPMQTIDLSTLTWHPCNYVNCDLNRNGLGKPASRFIDNSRIFLTGMQASVMGKANITLLFWLSTDFNDETQRDIVALLPSAIKIDVFVTPIGSSFDDKETPSGFSFAALDPTTKTGADFPVLGLDVVVGAPKQGTQGSLISVVSANRTTSYFPKEMNRIDIGSTTDQVNGFGSYLSWFATAQQHGPMCQSGSEASCILPLSNTAAAIKATEHCTYPSGGALCAHVDNMLQLGMSAYRMRYLVSHDSVLMTTSNVRASFYLGYYDPAEGMQKVINGVALGRMPHGLLQAALLALASCAIAGLFAW